MHDLQKNIAFRGAISFFVDSSNALVVLDVAECALFRSQPKANGSNGQDSPQAETLNPCHLDETRTQSLSMHSVSQKPLTVLCIEYFYITGRF